MSREQEDTKIDLGSTKNYFWEHQGNNSGSREKMVKFQRKPGAGDPPLQGLFNSPVHHMFSIGLDRSTNGPLPDCDRKYVLVRTMPPGNP